MFNWLKHHLARRAIDRRLQRHFTTAEGSYVQRGSIAAAMSEIEDPMLQRQRMKLSPEDQMVFMMTYECFMMSAIKRGLEAVLQPGDIELAIVAMQRHFAKHAWYRPGTFEKIWDQTQIHMRWALRPENMETFYPPADMLLVANQAGCSFNVVNVTDLSFGVHAGSMLGRLAGFAQTVANEHLRSKEAS
jgi:hypothetical protein